MDEYYTYAYLREDGTPYYIGKGKGNRINFLYNRRVKLPPEERRIYLKKKLTEQEAIKHEIYMIFVLGRKDSQTGILRNLTNGGEGISGCKRSLETREKMAKRNIGKKLNEETKQKISKSRKGKYFGKDNPNYGNKLTEEAKHNIIKKHYKLYEFISPEGKIVKEYTTIREFCRKYNLERKSVKYLIEGKFKQHKGWTINILS